MTSILIILLGILACVILSGFFSGSEMAYSSCSSLRLEHLRDSGSKRAGVAVKIAERFEDALGAILIGNNLVNIAASSLITVLVVKLTGSTEKVWLGTVIMLFGVLLVLGVDFGGMTLHVTDLYFILSAVCVSANAFIIKSAQEKYHEDADMISYYNNAVVLILFAGSAALCGDFHHLPANPGSGFWLLVALGGLAQTGIYFFYYRNLKHFEVWLVKLYLLLMPVLSCFIGVFFLNEELSTKKLLGILIVLAGAAVILQRGRINHQQENG